MRRLLPAPGPIRILALATAINTVGSGLLVSTLVLYLTRIVGLSGAEVGVGLSVGGAVGLLISVPLGHLADVRGAREVLIGLLCLLAGATLLYLMVGSFAGFVAAAALVVALEGGSSAVRQGLIARALPVTGRVAARAYLRAVTNAGFAVGSGLAIIAIALDTRAAYQLLIALDAVSYLVVAAVLTRLPRTVPEPGVAQPGGPRLVVLRDRPYLVVIAFTALLAIHLSFLDVGMPLWVSHHTQAPPAIVGVIFVLNCLAVVAFSVRVARGIDDPASAARAARRAGFILVAACGLMAASAGPPAAVAAALLVAAGLVHVTAEMLQAASQWGLSLTLAPEAAQGQYQAAAATGMGFAVMLGPLMMALVVSAGEAGWIAFGLAMAAVGAATVPVTRWATGRLGLSWAAP